MTYYFLVVVTRSLERDGVQIPNSRTMDQRLKIEKPRMATIEAKVQDSGVRKICRW